LNSKIKYPLKILKHNSEGKTTLFEFKNKISVKKFSNTIPRGKTTLFEFKNKISVKKFSVTIQRGRQLCSNSKIKYPKLIQPCNSNSFK